VEAPKLRFQKEVEVVVAALFQQVLPTIAEEKTLAE
jgi:hypothetical protein